MDLIFQGEMIPNQVLCKVSIYVLKFDIISLDW